ncbi:hypothetical protein U1Q18_031413 [Sarracenia purpurea var. burkii]
MKKWNSSLFLILIFSDIFICRTLAESVTPEEAKQLRDEIDSLDMLALLGDRERFSESVEWIGKNLQFDIVSFALLVLRHTTSLIFFS